MAGWSSGYDFSNADDGVDWARAVPASGGAFPGHAPPPPPPMTEQEREMEKLRAGNMQAGFIMTFPLPEDVERLPGAGSRPRAQARAYATPPPAGPARPSLEEALRAGAAKPKPKPGRMNKRGPSQQPAALPQVGSGAAWRGERPAARGCPDCGHPETKFCSATGAPHPPARERQRRAEPARSSPDTDHILARHLAMEEAAGTPSTSTSTYHNGDRVSTAPPQTPPPPPAPSTALDERMARALAAQEAVEGTPPPASSPPPPRAAPSSAPPRATPSTPARSMPSRPGTSDRRPTAPPAASPARTPPRPASPRPGTSDRRRTPRSVGAGAAPFATSSQQPAPAPAPRRGGAGEWEIADFSYDNLLALGTMAVSTGLSRAQLATMKAQPYVLPKDAAAEDCIVCLETLEEGDPSLRIVCSHVFHHSCILAWLAKTNRCPTCRHEVPRKDKLVM
eukprot:TRINITY_DN2904_c1_g3_i1.p1 TRINITY_DN2904_c1_g3~~TRINITY_DN2904_c1_g3_i1.p1  ORF type:complete len:493 (+),score=109.67 TRINITY_DN2904_c1_g3_i1:127-1479(+)